MTNKEAIEILKYERDNDCFVGTPHRRDVHNAIDKAIKALETLDDVSHKVYRNECAGCGGDKHD